MVGDRRPYVAALVTVDPEATARMSPDEVAAAVQVAVDRVNAERSRFEQIKRFVILPREFSAGGVLVRSVGGRPMLAAIRPHGRRAGVWALPKGRIDPGESAAATAVREVREETGVEGRLVEKLGDARWRPPPRREPKPESAGLIAGEKTRIERRTANVQRRITPGATTVPRVSEAGCLMFDVS